MINNIYMVQNHIHTCQVYQASTESGVDPAQNGGYDDHDGTGLPIGLFQYKLGTWRSWAVPGHANIHSALDQIMAVLNDSNWRNDFPPIGVKRGWVLQVIE
ncbi:hypothetical protein [Ligilactobacillus salivarius]|uniref:hypothetical protein n=1 Tax=Ligilactobacillus salivarius TaxID=1624 RepID=UPI001CDA9699|nr:hypothetical protein [Ligilactobacillus salivarius]